MNILMVHNFYQIGGGEHTVFANEVSLLRDHGNEVTEYTRTNDELKASRIKLLLMPFTTVWSFKTYREVRRIIREKGIEIVHCHNTFPLISPSVYYAARSLGVPVVQTVHNFRFLCPNGLFFCDGKICERCREGKSLKHALKHKCYRDSWIQTLVVVNMLRFHRLIGTYKKINCIFLTDFNRKKFADIIDVNGKNVFTKPNFVAGPAIKRQEISDKVVYAGRLDDNKGINVLLDRWMSVPPEYELHIYGDGPVRDRVEQMTQKYPNIKYFGFRPQEEMHEDLSSSLCLVFPSILYEGFPMSIAESMRLGCPVMASDLGNHGDIVRSSGCGTLFSPDSDESFISALEEIKRENRLFSQKALDYYTSRLSPEENYKRLIEIYETCRNN